MKKFKRFFALTLCLLTLCACSAQDEPLPADDGVQGQTDPAPDDAADTPATTEPQPDISESAPPEETEPAGDSEPSGQDKPPVPDETQAPDTVQDLPAEPSAPSEPEKPAEPPASDEPSVTISIRCDTVLDNMDSLSDAAAGIIPADGVILAETELTLSEGESVFDLLSRATRDNNVHMEYSSTPIYQSSYIEGIGNLYELDCGPLSGWMYRVNGVFPNYGCSKYAAQDGDVIEWVYTCDLGEDVGGADAFAGQKE